jgi:hypothetical protein
MNLTKVHEDARGAIHLIENLLPNNKEFTILEIKKGYARGGCYHKSIENWVVIKGIVRVGTYDVANFTNGVTSDNIVHSNIGASTGTSGVFRPGIAHYFEATEDAIVIEFGVATAEKIENLKFEPLFEIVQRINKKMENKS